MEIARKTMPRTSVSTAALFADLEFKPSMKIDEAEWDRVMQVNLPGVFTCVKAVVPEMQRNGYGKIVNISSGTVFMGTPMMLHYVSSKARSWPSPARWPER